MSAGATVRRLATVLGAMGFVGLVVGLPIAVNFRFASDALQRSWVYAGGRDAVMVTTPVRLSRAPHVILESGLVYDLNSGTARSGDTTTPASIVIDAPVVKVMTSHDLATRMDDAKEALPLILSQLAALSFDKLDVRRGTLIVESNKGAKEVLSDFNAEIVSNRKGTFITKGGAQYRGTTVTFDAEWSLPTDTHPSPRLPLKLAVKSSMLQANFDGKLAVLEDLRLQGAVDVAVQKLRQVARWFGIAVPSGSDLQNMTIKGTLDWGAGMLTFSRATLLLDGNEATGALTLNTGEALPSIEGTLAFQNFDLSRTSVLTPTVASLWPLGFGPGEEEGTLSLLTRFNADLRMSAAKVTIPYVHTGRGAATIAVKNGLLRADIAELELEGGVFGGQITADLSSPVPRYGLSGKLENIDAGRSLSGLLHRNPLQGRANMSLDLTGSGHDAAELLSSLSGKVGFALSEGGRLGLDLRALLYAAQRSEVKGWAAAGKGQTALEHLDAQLQIKNGVIMSERLQGKSAGLTIAGSGRIDMTTKGLDIALLLSNATAEAVSASGNTLFFAGNWIEPTIRLEQVPKRTAAPQQ